MDKYVSGINYLTNIPLFNKYKQKVNPIDTNNTRHNYLYYYNNYYEANIDYNYKSINLLSKHFNKQSNNLNNETKKKISFNYIENNMLNSNMLSQRIIQHKSIKSVNK